MKDYIDCIYGECKRYIHRGSMAAWLFILVLMLYQSHSAVEDIKSISEKNKTFKQNQQIYQNNMINYDSYRARGFKILLISPSRGLITKGSTNPSDLTAEVVSTHIKINNNWKGKVVFRQGRYLDLDIFGIIKWLISLMALWYGFQSFLKNKTTPWDNRKVHPGTGG